MMGQNRGDEEQIYSKIRSALGDPLPVLGIRPARFCRLKGIGWQGRFVLMDPEFVTQREPSERFAWFVLGTDLYSYISPER